MNKLKVNTLFVGVLFGLSVVSGVSSAAVKSCKGMDSSACKADLACSWVAAYKRKDGISVAAHCRTKRGGVSHSKEDGLLKKVPS